MDPLEHIVFLEDERSEMTYTGIKTSFFEDSIDLRYSRNRRKKRGTIFGGLWGFHFLYLLLLLLLFFLLSFFRSFVLTTRVCPVIRVWFTLNLSAKRHAQWRCSWKPFETHAQSFRVRNANRASFHELDDANDMIMYGLRLSSYFTE